MKFDGDKLRVGLMMRDFPRALLAVSAATTLGAKKYAPSNWISVEDAEDRYADAKGRHLLEGFITPNDKESNLLHLAHEAWNALAVLELELRKQERKTKKSHAKSNR